MSQTPKPRTTLTRQQRYNQLRKMDRDEVNELFFASLSTPGMPPPGTLMFKTILDYEYGPSDTADMPGPA
jgi:hypothetical protein